MGVDSYTECSNRTRGNGQKLELRKFHTKTRMNFFTAGVAENWNRLPRETVKSSLVKFRTCPDSFLCNVQYRTCFSWGVGLDDHQRFLPASTFVK